MKLFTTNDPSASGVKRPDWLPSLLALSVAIPAVAGIVLRGRPMVVSAAVFSAYGAFFMFVTAAIFRKRSRRTVVVTSLAAGGLFTLLSVTCAYLMWRR